MSVPRPSSPIPPLKSKTRPLPISTPSNTPSQPGTNNSPGDNWRDRSAVGGSMRSAVRTVGGFTKPGSEAVSPGVKTGRKDLGRGGAGPVTGGGEEEDGDGDSKGEFDGMWGVETDEGSGIAAALAHVPCRFYKAGSCTAGNNCPFSHEEGGKREICQWFLKGNCKFGHKCALAHVRPGEPMSMDRKNKKDAQREAKGERPDNATASRPVNASPQHQQSPKPQYQQQEPIATPVPIRSALSSSIQSPPAHRMPSSPLREPFGPPSHSGGSPGFGRPSPSGPPHGFASSPSRPSPLSSSFNGTRGSVPAPATLSLKSPLRPPTTAFSSSFSHTTLSPDNRPAPLSASFADNSMMRKSIWARSETPAEPLSPRNRPILPQSQSHPLFHVRKPTSSGDVFLDDEDDEHGQDLLPSSLIDDVLLPTERARRLSRRDSQESHSASPARHAFALHAGWNGGERLAQSAGPTPGFLQNLWSADGADSRKVDNLNQGSNLNGGTPPYTTRTSLLTQQRSPNSPAGYKGVVSTGGAGVDGAFLMRGFGGPSSPSARALMEHEPGMSLPSGVAGALSRLHLQGGVTRVGEGEVEGRVPGPGAGGSGGKREEHDDEGIFSMDG